jgi:hypothetical protein
MTLFVDSALWLALWLRAGHPVRCSHDCFCCMSHVSFRGPFLRDSGPVTLSFLLLTRPGAFVPAVCATFKRPAHECHLAMHASLNA